MRAARFVTNEGESFSPGLRPEQTMMFKEAQEAPVAVRRQLQRNAGVVDRLAADLRERKPKAIVTLARGSSDHAATFARYLFETRARVLTSSLSPSVGSIYEAMPDLSDTIVLAISQSGRSPDLLNAARQAMENGGRLVAMVNDEASPLASMADVFLPLDAGPERSVAASKSFIASLAAVLHLLSAWTADPSIGSALSTLGDKLDESWELDWSEAEGFLLDAGAMYVAGRGHGLGIAQEAALKFKETCGIHAEAYSAAELRHGPMAIVRSGFPVLLFGQSDQSLEGVRKLAVELEERGACLISAGVANAPGLMLPVATADALIAPILEIASFYRLANSLALARGRDPDRPPHLAKVTETL